MLHPKPRRARRPRRPAAPLLLVGIGVSRSALPALRSFCAALPARSGLSFVIVPAADVADLRTFSDELARAAKAPVVTLRDRMHPERDRIYLSPRSSLVTLEEGRVRVKRLSGKDTSAVLDAFFGSLARSHGTGAVAILLSGPGSEGALGLKAVAERCGMTMVEEPPSGGERTAVPGVELADHVLPPAQMAQVLLAYAHRLAERPDEAHQGSIRQQIGAALPVICDVLLSRTGHDFGLYRSNTLVRRIQRRLQVLGLEEVGPYLERLRGDGAEAQALFRELLIRVSGFFRDPEAFEILGRKVVRKILDRKAPADAIRIWVPGCATGEEAYSLAILVREQLDETDAAPAVQIFATDIDESALRVAREGVYPVGIAEEVSPDRRERFFVENAKGYRVSKRIRELCLFSRHNLIADPPFSHLDLVSCRNLLIYLGPQAQSKLVPLFHFALAPGAFLFLGSSENIVSHRELFRVVDAKHRIWQRNAVAPESRRWSLRSSEALLRPDSAPSSSSTDIDVEKIARRIVLDELAPRYAVVEERGRILSLSPGIGKYLEPVAGPFENHIVKMARPGLRVALRAVLAEARASRRNSLQQMASLKIDKGFQPVKIIVQPILHSGERPPLFLVVFEDAGPVLTGRRAKKLPATDPVNALIEQLERELETTREDLERTVQELESSNEELKSSNEELISMNEELQSANEELQTAKEEVQAGNEALSRANTDLENLLASTRIATLFLDDDLRVRSFTAAGTEIYNLIATDIGRPLTDITHRAIAMPAYPDPEALRGASGAVEEEIWTSAGRSYLRRVLPYRTSEGEVRGMVVTFTEITALRESERAARERLAEIETLYQSSPIGMCFLDRELRFVRVNESLAAVTGRPVASLVGKTLREVVGRRADSVEPTLRAILETGNPLRDLEIRASKLAEPHGEAVWQVSYFPLKDAGGKVLGIHVVAEEITQRRRAERRIEAEHAVVRVIAGAKSLEEAAPRILEAFSRALEVEVGELWLAGDGGRELTRVASYLARPEHEGARRFDRVGAETRLAPGPGIPGRVWESRSPAWVENLVEDRSFRRRKEAREIGIQTALCFPILVGEEILGAFVFFWRGRHGADEALIDTAVAVGRQVGHFIQRARAEEELRRSEARFRAALQSSPLMVYHCDRDLRYTWLANPHPDWPVERVIGRRDDELAPAEVVAPLITLKRRALDTEKAVRGEIALETSLGKQFWEITAEPLRDSDGRVSGLTVAALEITELKQSLETLQEREERLRSVLDNVVDGIITIDETGTIQSFNPAAERIFGHSASEVFGRNVSLLMPEPYRTEHGDYVARYRATGEAKIIGIGRELLGLRKDGSMFPLYLAIGEFVLGGRRFFTGIVRDVTEARRAEEALKESEQRFHTMADTIPEVIFTCTPEGDCDYLNARFYELTGMTPGSAEGSEWTEVVHSDDLPSVLEEWRTAVESGTRYEKRERFRLASGEYRWFLSRARPIHDGAGRVTKWFGSATDIDELVLAEESLQEAARQKDRFLAMLAHELRNPLAPVRNAVQVLEMIPADDPRAPELRAIISRQVSHFARLLDDLLDVSRIARGKVQLRKERIDLLRVVQETAEDHRDFLAGKELALELNLPSEPVWVQGDATRISQIVGNLLHNAGKFTDRGGKVSVTLAIHPSDRQALVAIRDTGIGMDERTLRSLFQPFHQAERTLDRTPGGLGLGLALVKRLVELHGGAIEARSEGERRGSEFRIRFPLDEGGGETFG